MISSLIYFYIFKQLCSQFFGFPLSILFVFLSLKQIRSEYFATTSDNLGFILTSETGLRQMRFDYQALILDDGLLKISLLLIFFSTRLAVLWLALPCEVYWSTTTDLFFLSIQYLELGSLSLSLLRSFGSLMVCNSFCFIQLFTTY